MRKAFVFWLLATAALALSMPAGACGDNGTTKWTQLPDLSATGMNVNATFRGDSPFVKVLADDFQCTSAGYITAIQVWGSWLEDNVSLIAPIKLSIHADVPANVDAPYSHPGAVLWQRTFSVGEYSAGSGGFASESFYDPNTDTIIGHDQQVLQYDFSIPRAAAFLQQGTAGQPVVYWLDVQAQQAQPSSNTIFGWKTSLNHWNDDAAFADTQTFGGLPTGPMAAPVYWKHMHYPAGHDLAGQSIDLAFAITSEPVPEPGTCALLLALAATALAACAARRWR